MPRCEFATVRRAARIVHEILDELGLAGWPKTSGGNGLHVYVRIEPRWGFTDLRRAAHAFAREVERRAPGEVTTTWWRKDRDPTVVFVDYNQNARDHTIASAYSVRGVPEATVSTPITWDEIDDVDPRQFTIATVPARSPSSATCTRASTAPPTRWTPCWNGQNATASTKARPAPAHIRPRRAVAMLTLLNCPALLDLRPRATEPRPALPSMCPAAAAQRCADSACADSAGSRPSGSRR